MPTVNDCRPFRPSAGHRYDPTSGYCIFWCGCRNDGHVVNRAGDIIRHAVVKTPLEQLLTE